MKKLSIVTIVVLLLCTTFISYAQQQVADKDFAPKIDKPLYAQGKGPLMLVDAGHHNFHTLDGRYAAFGKVAEMDGFRVKSTDGNITAEKLKGAKVLVIANALNEKNETNWRLPVYHAFTEEEVRTISQWVKDGGSLFLIADHMPFPEAVASLAGAFGFTLYNGFALRGPNTKYDVFSYENGMLQQTKLTDMHGKTDSIVTFTGHAFEIPEGATSVLTFGSDYQVLLPEEAWKFSRDMEMMPAKGMSQLAYLSYGKGKVVVSGEAMMFSAQKVGDIKVGMNAPFAPNNLHLLLNILEWLGE